MADEVRTESPQPAPGGEVEQAKGTAWLSYLGILWLIPLLTLKENGFAKFHVKQGIILCIAWVAVSVIGSIVPFLGWFIILPVGSIILLIFMIMGIVNSIGGKYWIMPFGLGKLAAAWFKF